MNTDVVKTGRMPVRVLAPMILKSFENINPEFAKTIEFEIRENQLKSTVIYDNRERAIVTAAEIDEDGREIYISESYLAFLWCLSYTTVVFYIVRDSVGFEGPIERAVKLFDYGRSLFRNWSEWDLQTPNPEFPHPDDQHIDTANMVMLVASMFTLCHEFGHQYLGHLERPNTDREESIEDEFKADSYAVACTLDFINKGVVGFEHTVKIGLVVGIASILFIDGDIRGGAGHPDADQRIIQILEKITNDDPESEYWVHALVLLNIWELVYHGKPIHPPVGMTAREHFEWLSKELKNGQ